MAGSCHSRTSQFDPSATCAAANSSAPDPPRLSTLKDEIVRLRGRSRWAVTALRTLASAGMAPSLLDTEHDGAP